MAGNTFKAFSKREERDHTTSTDSRERFLAWQEEKKAIANDLYIFGGRRLLGVTKKGTPIYATYVVDRDTLDIQVGLTHEMKTIRQSELCPRKITVGLNETSPDIGWSMRPKMKGDIGEVTQKTLSYIEDLFAIAESPTMAKVKGKCSSLLFMWVSNCIYTGSTEKNKALWHDIKTQWRFPSGAYFSVWG